MNSPTNSGLLFWVMGSPECGRDRILGQARRLLGDHPRVRFVDRVTVGHQRALGDQLVSTEQFQQQQSAGDFAMSWSSSEGFVGLPAIIDQWLDQNYNVVVAGSRYSFEQAMARYEDELIAVFVRRHEGPEPVQQAPDQRERTEVIRKRVQTTGPRIESPQMVSVSTAEDLERAGNYLIKLFQGRRICA